MPRIKKIIAAILLSSATIGVSTALAETAKPDAIAPRVTTATSEFVYNYLLAEIAFQRGEATLASRLYLELAKQTRDVRIAERAARVAAYAKQPAIALQSSIIWAELDPNSTEAQQASSQLLIASGNFKQAKPYIQKLLSKPDTRANGFLYLNTLLANQRDKNEVLQTVQELAKPYPKLPEAQLAVAQAALIANQPALAKTALANAEKLKPGWEAAALMQGQMLFRESPEKPISFYQNFLKKYPNANDVRMSYAKLLVNQKRHAEAKPEFVKLIDASQGSPEISTVVGLLSLESNDYKAADQYFEQALSNGFKEPEQLYIYLGRSSERQKNDAQALVWYDKIPNTSERYLEGRFSAANVVARTKDVDTAIAMLDELEGLTPEQQAIIIQTQASMLGQAKRNQESFDLISKAVQTLPNSPELLYDYAMAAERVGKLDVMESELRRVILVKPDYAAAYNALGYSYADRNIKLDEAKSLIETALKLQPGDHYMLDSLGWVHYRLGNLALAAEHLRKAYDIQTDPEIAAHLGEVLWQQGLQEEAKKVWGTALKEHPENDVLLATTKKFGS